MHERLVAVGQCGVRVRSVGGSRAGEMRITRFLRNGKVSVEEIVDHACASIRDRVRGRHILAIQDTTSLRDDGAGRGIVAHPTIGIDRESGALLGLIHTELLDREGGKAASRAQHSIKDKQSYRWLEGAERAATLLAAGATGVTVIGDRESDIYEMFAQRPEGVDLLIRARHDRKLVDKQLLSARLAELDEAGQMTVSLPAGPGRAARDLTLSLRYCKVRFKRPAQKTTDMGLADDVEVYVVDATEISPPPGKTPAHWRLVTTHPVTKLEEACTMVRLYRERWTIEQLFRVLKTKGFDIEAVRISDAEPFKKLAVACLVAAVSVLQLVRDRDGLAQRPLDDVFDVEDTQALEAVSRELEGKTAKQKNPHAPGSLAFAAWVCARLGGWTGYYGKPGPVVMLNGMQQFMALKRGWSLARHV